MQSIKLKVAWVSEVFAYGCILCNGLHACFKPPPIMRMKSFWTCDAPRYVALIKEISTVMCCTTQYFCGITCCAGKPVYRTHVFIKHERYLHCISKQGRLIQLYFQADVWPCDKTAACRANDLGSMLTHAEDFIIYFVSTFLNFLVRPKMIFRYNQRCRRRNFCKKSSLMLLR